MKALFLPAEGYEPHVIDRPDLSELSTLQSLVGGLIECVPVDPDTHLWVNEEGGPLGLPVNVEASRLAGRVIVGNAVLIGTGTDGDDTDVPGAWIDRDWPNIRFLFEDEQEVQP